MRFLKSWENKKFIWAIFIFSILAISNFIWLKIDTRPPHWDASNHLMHSLTRFEWFSHPSWENFRHFYGGYTYYPPFVYWVTSVFYWFFGKGEDVAVSSNFLFLAILVFSTYGIAKYFWGSKTGLLSALITSVMPVLLSQSREYQLDFPLTAMVALAIYLLLKTETFRNRIYSILFGFSFALGFLTKWTFVAFLITPLLYFLVKLIYENIQEKKIDDPRWLNVCLSFLVILFLAGPWYIWNLSKLKISFAENIQCGISEGDPQTFLPSLLWYLKFWVINHMRLLLLIPFVVGFILTFLKKEIFQRNLFLLLFLIVGFFIMVFYSNKDIRFIEPLMPLVAILSSYWVFLLPRKFSFWGVGYLILVAIFYFWTISFCLRSLPVSLSFNYKNFSFPLYIQYGYTVGAPVKENWQQQRILRDIIKIKNGPNQVVRLNMFYQDKMFFNKENFKYYIMLFKYPIDLRYPFSQSPEAEKGDFLLVNSKTKEEADKLVEDFKKELINQYSLPDQTFAFLYQLR